MNILLEGVPEEVEMDKVTESLRSVAGVVRVHDLHVWALSSGKVSLTAHVVTEPGVEAAKSVLPAIRRRLAEMDIHHVTIQCELEPCEQASTAEHFAIASRQR